VLFIFIKLFFGTLVLLSFGVVFFSKVLDGAGGVGWI